MRQKHSTTFIDDIEQMIEYVAIQRDRITESSEEKLALYKLEAILRQAQQEYMYEFLKLASLQIKMEDKQFSENHQLHKLTILICQ